MTCSAKMPPSKSWTLFGNRDQQEPYQVVSRIPVCQRATKVIGSSATLLSEFASMRIPVRASDAHVDASVDVGTEGEYAIETTDGIYASVRGTRMNGPRSWDNIDHDPTFDAGSTVRTSLEG